MNTAATSRVAAYLKMLFEWYTTAGTEHHSREERQAVYILAVVLLATSVSLWGWAVFYLIYDAQSTWPASVACMFFSISLFAPALARQSRFAAEIFISALTCALFSMLSYFYGANAGLNLPLLVGALFLTLECGTKRLVSLSITITPMLVLAGMLPIWFPEPNPVWPVGSELVRLIYITNAVNLIGVVLLCMVIILRRAEQAEAALDREHARSEALLRNLLPDEIAVRLKNKPGEIIADGLPAVTLLFADIVDFTPRAARMAPEELVGFLNRIFSAFDKLTAERGLEKIKTIGDAYMVAAGLPAAREDHAEIIAEMALAMQSKVSRLSAEMGETIELRIGIHSGPAIAGVIGTSKVFYDVWGDTVNTASRMESHGEPGRIQVTGATRAVLGEAFRYEPRGMVEIKGIGEIETFWLAGRA